jgi:Lrp/AsnC family transcriptional regulator
MLDKIDRQLLGLLQEDGALSVVDMAAQIFLSVTPCWHRLQRLKKEGCVRCRVPLPADKRLNFGMTVFTEIRISQHSPSWLEQFSATINLIREVVEMYRLSGGAGYLSKALVPDLATHDSMVLSRVRNEH